MKRIVVLVSGNGSNLQALIDAGKKGLINGQIVGVFSNNEQAVALQRAKQANIFAAFVNPKSYKNRLEFDLNLAELIDHLQPDLVVLAGYMRILSPEFVQRYAERLLNIHPSLLPKYPGLHTHRQALSNGDREHGTTVHFVTEQLDAGPIILQASIALIASDNEEQLAEKVKVEEYRIYPQVVSWFCDNRLTMRDGKAWLDGHQLPPQGFITG